MEYLFEAAGRQALQTTLGARPLLAFDFDGTLAPIVQRPDDARVAPALSARLDRLARLRPVAVITGRSVADVAGRLGFAPRYIVGNHGAEDPEQPANADGSRLDGLRARLAAHANALREACVRIEDKRLSLALHYRDAPDPGRAVACIEDVLAGLDPGLTVFGGKYVINAVLSGAPDKADAVASLVRRAGCDSTVFVGDDVNDEGVFERALPGWLTVRVGRDDPRSHAGFFLGSHLEVERLLDEMLALLRGS